jgi:hypothetical protein
MISKKFLEKELRNLIDNCKSDRKHREEMINKIIVKIMKKNNPGGKGTATFCTKCNHLGKIAKICFLCRDGYFNKNDIIMRVKK